DAGDLAELSAEVRQHLVERRALGLWLKLDEHPAAVERSAIGADGAADMGDIGRLGEDVSHLLLQLQHGVEGNILALLRRDLKLADVFLWEEALGDGFEQIDGEPDAPQENQKHHEMMAKTEADKPAVAPDDRLE